ncbi:AimR family lysis-lysogeny pheromone receptor [Shouchella miscanthi]|uniref:AimR family lysis-lysogeny pheromone receptor n=1 Tax=Shouchella miscanthi TaxID=2598861 RepID=UPI0011A8DAB7|nr:AimR family lysis-lysogeny pheromone receptor [Shouchella miscanthi]
MTVKTKATLESALYLHEIVKGYMNEKNIAQVDISNAIDLPQVYISRFLKAAGKNDLEFATVIAIVRFLAPSNFLEIMDNYCIKLEKPLGIMNALEFASNYKRADLTDNLIAMHSDKKGEIKDWLDVYDLNRRKPHMTTSEIVESCKSLYGKVSSIEMKIKLDLIETVSTYRNDYRILLQMADRLEPKLDKVRGSFIKDSFKVKLYVFFANAHLYFNNNVDKARYYADFVINSNVAPLYLVASAHLTTGHSHMFTDRDKSIKQIDRAALLFKGSHHDSFSEELKTNDIPFVLNYHKIIIETPLKGEELAHQYIVRGELDKASEVLNETGNDNPFTSLYKGMVTKDIQHLLNGHAQIVKMGMLFYKTIFEREINNLLNERR